MTNRLFLTFAFTSLAAISAFAQEQPRRFDNSDSRKSIALASSSGASLSEIPNVGKEPARVAQNPYAPSPVTRHRGGHEPNPASRTAKASMTVYDGIAQPEIPRQSAAPQMTMSAGKNLKGFSTGDDLIDAYIIDSSRRYNIDPLLIYAQMKQESSFRPHATSHKGASGLMQLMPPTARRMGVTNIYDPKQNIEGGVKYMRLLLNLFNGDVSLALAGYNAGEGAVMKYGYQIPPYAETRDYVKRISARYQAISRPTTTARHLQKPGTPLSTEATTVRMDDGRTRLTNK